MPRPPFELRILGPTELRGPQASTEEEPSDLVRRSKRLALMGYLAIATADGFRRRDHVIALFWPEYDQATGRTYLRKALHGIRESLGEDLFVTRGEDELRVDSDRLWCDAVALVEGVRERRWSEALTNYRGELLEGLFPEGVANELHEWLSATRKKLREQAAYAAWQCADLEETRGDRTAAAVMARRARELDPDNEEGVRRLMALLDRRGDRGSALRAYGEWQTRLIEEFGAEPAPETRKLARHIQAARKGESHETPPVAPPAASAVHETIELAATPTLSQRPRARRRRVIGVLTSGIGGVALALVVFAAFRSGAPTPPEANRSVAVPPLSAIGGARAEQIAVALGEELFTRLAVDPSLRVQAAARSVAPTNNRISAFSTDGGVQRSGEKIRVTLRLLRTADGVAVWARSYDEPDGDPAALAQRIAEAAVGEIRVRLRER